MRFINDHDPLPLLNQLEQRYGASITIQYRQRESGQIMIDFIRTCQIAVGHNLHSGSKAANNETKKSPQYYHFIRTTNLG